MRSLGGFHGYLSLDIAHGSGGRMPILPTAAIGTMALSTRPNKQRSLGRGTESFANRNTNYGQFVRAP